MTSGSWLNNDGMYLQFGTQKAVPELAGDYKAYAANRVLEILISPGALSFGTPANQANSAPLPSSFQGTIASQTATANTGIVSYTTLFPLQPTAPVTAPAATSILSIVNPQIYIDQIDVEVLVAFTAGTSSATGLTGVGLVVALPANGANPSSWAQVTPNAGVQFLGAATNAQMTAGKKWSYLPDGAIIGSTNPPVAGSWLGNVPLTTLAETFLPGSLPNNAYISAIASGGAYSGATATAGGLMRMRVFYNIFGSINDATSI